MNWSWRATALSIGLNMILIPVTIAVLDVSGLPSFIVGVWLSAASTLISYGLVGGEKQK